ncbi:ferritin heavy chain-like [Mastomys coucha]|uniref:ferritin heavy chain-like n=1 Tax=Mastomys coucha TaxID=35658 RepID=UPI0012619221|nr:ferritin heavy chain-like [Mastomys coucha]
MFSYHPFSEECTKALNEVVAYHLHTSHVYLAMVHNFKSDDETYPFVSYFETLADSRREYADKFLQHLWTRNKKICPPIYEKVDMKEITTPIKAILLAQKMEVTLTSILRGLKAVARRESDLLTFLASVLRKQGTNEDFMKSQLTQLQKTEKKREKGPQTENPSTSSGAEGFNLRSKKSKLELTKPE